MTPPFRTHHAATNELTAAVAWYEQQRAGLGADFFDEVARTIDRIREHPKIGTPSSAQDRTRRVLVLRFPYELVYQVRPDEIVIVAVAHSKRRPGYWKQRVSP